MLFFNMLYHFCSSLKSFITSTTSSKSNRIFTNIRRRNKGIIVIICLSLLSCSLSPS
ncbi:hypothetical protein NBO_437g0003 [Nosema bombycis CQ1]|uniref:Uncharacterized protein n=1 Tax=Nosema bombycis (strain CQ1 / CVCC 102059) TaxID=578461 RepID=R0MEE3_NOSB1|nr:hypothetical protein NBO_437g0003 [Nosema bombycis CQ1]|eukprot:EOB12460.1 hypothetical protein NBO_437g0003 [Nosema bombycis CQ1]